MRNGDEFKLYGHHHDLLGHYKIPITQMTMDLFIFAQDLLMILDDEKLFTTKQLPDD